MNQRPSGYRTAPVAVPEICCLLFAAPDFDRGPSSSSLALPQAAVGLVTQQATNAQKKTHRLLTMSLTRAPCRMKRKESRRELRPDSGGCGTTFGLSHGAGCGARNLLLAVCCARFRPRPFLVLPCSATGSGRTCHPTSYQRTKKDPPPVDDEPDASALPNEKKRV